jgi:hypothetical protein
VAELVLAGPQYRATGKLRLSVVAGGFATTALTPGLRVDGLRVAGAAGVTVAIGGRTPRALGAELGVAESTLAGEGRARSSPRPQPAGLQSRLK